MYAIAIVFLWLVTAYSSQASAQSAVTKRIYFFKDNTVRMYDPRPSADQVVDGPHLIEKRLHGLRPPFTAGIDAAVNWGNGFIYLFKGDSYWKYDILLDRAATSDPVRIADGWPDFPSDFKLGIDAAFNSGENKAYFFKGSQYLRYNISEGVVDRPDPGTPPYPRAISGPNGWRNMPPAYASGIDAAVNTGNGKIYFLKGNSYVRITFASRTVDEISPPYPYPVAGNWRGLPDGVRGSVEWGQAGPATLVTAFHSGCQNLPPTLLGGGINRVFTVEARFAKQPYPATCGCSEYRQFVRGSHVLNGVPVVTMLPDSNGGGDRPMLPIPPSGAPDENFLEDSNPNGTVHFYGHRSLPDDPLARYDEPDKKTGCHYKMVDSPFIVGAPGQTASFDLQFKGVVVDVCNGNEIVKQERWSASCSGVIVSP